MRPEWSSHLHRPALRSPLIVGPYAHEEIKMSASRTTRDQGLVWIKAQASVTNGACVELADEGAMLALRDSKNPDVVLHYSRAEIAAFLDGAKKGEFDHLVEPH